MQEITQEVLKELFTYNPVTGLFYINKSNSNRHKVGSPVNGAINKVTGYVQIGINRKTQLYHRMVWLYNYGYIPKNLDHINGNKLDNSLNNLRAVTHTDNMRNKKVPTNNTTGTMGIRKRKDSYCAAIFDKSKYVHLGSFPSQELAIKARKEAEKFYGYHENHGRLA